MIFEQRFLADDITEATTSWLKAEYEYVSKKFGEDQSEPLQATRLTDPTNFGGQTAMYWKRMLDARASDQPLRAAQAAAKVASASRSLFATVRSLDWRSDRLVLPTTLEIAETSLQNNYRQAKSYIEKPDFWVTPIGLGLSYLEVSLQSHGLNPKFRLSHLLRTQQIFEDATQVMAVQFEWTHGETGQLPQPGLPSGYLEPWE